MFPYRITHKDKINKSEMKRFIIEGPYLPDVFIIITLMLLIKNRFVCKPIYRKDKLFVNFGTFTQETNL